MGLWSLWRREEEDVTRQILASCTSVDDPGCRQRKMVFVCVCWLYLLGNFLYKEHSSLGLFHLKLRSFSTFKSVASPQGPTSLLCQITEMERKRVASNYDCFSSFASEALSSISRWWTGSRGRREWMEVVGLASGNETIELKKMKKLPLNWFEVAETKRDSMELFYKKVTFYPPNPLYWITSRGTCGPMSWYYHQMIILRKIISSDVVHLLNCCLSNFSLILTYPFLIFFYMYISINRFGVPICTEVLLLVATFKFESSHDKENYF